MRGRRALNVLIAKSAYREPIRGTARPPGLVSLIRHSAQVRFPSRSPSSRTTRQDDEANATVVYLTSYYVRVNLEPSVLQNQRRNSR